MNVEGSKRIKTTLLQNILTVRFEKKTILSCCRSLVLINKCYDFFRFQSADYIFFWSFETGISKLFIYLDSFHVLNRIFKNTQNSF